MPLMRSKACNQRRHMNWQARLPGQVWEAPVSGVFARRLLPLSASGGGCGRGVPENSGTPRFHVSIAYSEQRLLKVGNLERATACRRSLKVHREFVADFLAWEPIAK